MVLQKNKVYKYMYLVNLHMKRYINIINILYVHIHNNK